MSDAAGTPLPPHPSRRTRVCSPSFGSAVRDLLCRDRPRAPRSRRRRAPGSAGAWASPPPGCCSSQVGLVGLRVERTSSALVGPLARFGARRATGRHRWSAALAPWRGPGSLRSSPASPSTTSMRSAPSVGSPERVGLIADRGDGSVSLVLRVHGEGFLLADAAEKDARLAAFGDALASLAPRGEPSRPRHLVSARRAGPPRRALRLPRPDESRRARRGDRLFLRRPPRRTTARRAVSSEVLVTLTVAIGRGTPGSRRGERALRLRRSTRLLEEAELFSTVLARAGLFAVGPLPAGAIARALRDRLDPTARRHLERRGRSLADLAGLVTPENGFPLSVEEHRRFVATDGSVHRIFRVAEWPRLSVRADWLAGFLCEQDVTRSFTVIYTPLGRRLARRQALAVATRVGASIDERELKGRGSAPRSVAPSSPPRPSTRSSNPAPRWSSSPVWSTSPPRARTSSTGSASARASRRRTSAWSSAPSTSATPRRSSPRSPSAVSSRDGHDELRRSAPRRWSSRDKAPCSITRLRRQESRACCASADSR